MAGVYFHIPFCKQACTYCDFHFRVGLKDDAAMTEAMLKEIREEANFPFEKPLDSVYFGGGTPSLFDPERIEAFIEASRELFGLEPEAEITLEANPDDLNPERMKAYREIGVNRLSIGVQTFNDELLKRFGRPHNAEEAAQCLKDAAEHFPTFSADLIFGMSGYAEKTLENDLLSMFELGAPHISTYGLTIEPDTVLARQIEKGTESPPDEEEMKNAYERIMQKLQEAGYEHYEISNFAKPGHRAVHNASYWSGEPYLGVGPAAHSFDGRNRWWNIPKNARYIRGIRASEPEREIETYDPVDRANERMLTSLRTAEGLLPDELREYGLDLWELRGEELRSMMQEGVLAKEKERLRLTRKGKLLADRVSERLFILKDDR